MANVFAEYVDAVYPYKFAGDIKIQQLMGGTPSDPKVAEGWLKSKMGLDKEDIIAKAVEEVMAARSVDQETALKEVDKRRHLTGFKREQCPGCPEKELCATGRHPLYIEGRHLKAMLKEAASVARAVDNLDSRYGATSKGVLSFVAEHIVVVEDRLYIDRLDPASGKVDSVLEPTGILQSFPRNPITRQTGIQYTEYIEDAIVGFTVVSDYPWKHSEWATMWVTGGNQGIGASRSQGYGRFDVTRWEQIGTPPDKPRPVKATPAAKKAAAKAAA